MRTLSSLIIILNMKLKLLPMNKQIKYSQIILSGYVIKNKNY